MWCPTFFRYFGFVLDYLRNGANKLPANLPTDEVELERVKEEFDFFLIRAFETAIVIGAYLMRSATAQHLTSSFSAEDHRIVRDVAISDRYVVVVHAPGGDSITSGGTSWTPHPQVMEVWDVESGRHFHCSLSDHNAESPSWARAIDAFGLSIYGNTIVGISAVDNRVLVV